MAASREIRGTYACVSLITNKGMCCRGLTAGMDLFADFVRCDFDLSQSVD